MKFLIPIVFLISSIAAVFSKTTDTFETKLSEYTVVAKETSKKSMTPEDEAKLSNMVVSILGGLQKEFIQNKLQSEKIVFQFSNEHKFENKYDEQLIKFTIGFSEIFLKLSQDDISEIIKKSPLEFIPFLREMNTFLKFITANPKDYGHGIFAEKEGKTTTIHATDEAILRIMKPIAYKNLFQNENDFFKLSRLTSAFYKNFPTKKYEEIFNWKVKQLKRNMADDSRVAIFKQNFEVTPSTIGSKNANDYASVKNSYYAEIQKYKNGKTDLEKKDAFKKAKEHAKTLLGIVPGMKLSIYSYAEKFCKTLEKLSSELKDKADDKKAVRDLENYQEIAKFLKTGTKLLDTLYANENLLDNMLEKCGENIPYIATEIIKILQVIELIMAKNNDVEKIIESIRDFGRESEDGTHLLSIIFSVAMENIDNCDFVKIIDSTDFKNKDLCKYLKVR